MKFTSSKKINFVSKLHFFVELYNLFFSVLKIRGLRMPSTASGDPRMPSTASGLSGASGVSYQDPFRVCIKMLIQIYNALEFDYLFDDTNFVIGHFFIFFILQFYIHHRIRRLRVVTPF